MSKNVVRLAKVVREYLGLTYKGKRAVRAYLDRLPEEEREKIRQYNATTGGRGGIRGGVKKARPGNLSALKEKSVKEIREQLAENSEQLAEAFQRIEALEAERHHKKRPRLRRVRRLSA